jgi:hypothetical protein
MRNSSLQTRSTKCSSGRVCSGETASHLMQTQGHQPYTSDASGITCDAVKEVAKQLGTSTGSSPAGVRVVIRSSLSSGGWCDRRTVEREVAGAEANTFRRFEDLWQSPTGDISHASNIRSTVFSDTADSCTAKCRLLRGLRERRIGTGTGSTVLPDKLDLRSPEVQVLRQSMSDAHEECEKAYLRYERAFSIAAHTNPLNFSGVIALQRSGRDYAKAIARHSNAVMSWLALVDRSR